NSYNTGFFILFDDPGNGAKTWSHKGYPVFEYNQIGFHPFNFPAQPYPVKWIY
ncbi:unnamed protein product, partial [marine sediment metagenome]